MVTFEVRGMIPLLSRRFVIMGLNLGKLLHEGVPLLEDLVSSYDIHQKVDPEYTYEDWVNLKPKEARRYWLADPDWAMPYDVCVTNWDDEHNARGLKCLEEDVQKILLISKTLHWDKSYTAQIAIIMGVLSHQLPPWLKKEMLDSQVEEVKGWLKAYKERSLEHS